MNFINRYNFYFLLSAFFSIAILLYIISNISISYKESLIYFENKDLIAKLANLSVSYFGNNDYALKLPNLIFHFFNLLLIYLISKKILKYKIDSILCVIIYSFIPCVIMQGSILNESIITLFVVLLICYVELVKTKLVYFLLFTAIFISPSTFMLFIAFFFYAVSKRDKKLAIFSIFCFGINIYVYGIDISGKPSGRFLDVFGELALLYSPPLFIYYVYTLYRNLTKDKPNLLLYISIISFVISFILSIRQEIYKEIFLFMSLCGIPLMIKQFLSDIRVRLPMFQNAYKNRFIVVIIFLLFEVLLLVFSKQIYIFVENKDKIFLNEFYIAKEISRELKTRNIKRVTTDKKMQNRLRFYGIKQGGALLKKVAKNGNIIIEYNNQVVARYAI
ncbi:hypothetical protein [Helicobacter sp. MIT 14-3879]|uniref:hypothetical protein n=1 Tax=Helicobacter sp. MIT 14-3879 TaxID=2040649 RepID=UPI000E1F69B5|nr:hypothetical protein [Helicobacter sp. MIT 14-3879]RDU60929.1 hypothetical protein CQA44_09890 [Helicobacter sp. MIT 14-3879]